VLASLLPFLDVKNYTELVWGFLTVTSSTFEKGVFIQTGEVAGRSAEVRKALLQTFDVVICDSTGLVNLSSRVTKSALAEVCAALVHS
jgi:hypothetical protein